eukprot:6198698-Pleurochrysis_carterae.AAC.1
MAHAAATAAATAAAMKLVAETPVAKASVGVQTAELVEAMLIEMSASKSASGKAEMAPCMKAVVVASAFAMAAVVAVVTAEVRESSKWTASVDVVEVEPASTAVKLLAVAGFESEPSRSPW